MTWYSGPEIDKLEAENVTLKAELEQVKQREAQLRKAIELYKDASYQGHSSHWDKTMGGGSGCPECIRARELRNQAEAALKEVP